MLKQHAISGKSAASIAASLEAAVASGVASDGDLLPTVRSLAQSLHVSPVTVNAAYKLLRGRGLISTEGRRGTRFAHGRRMPAPPLRLAVEGTVDLASGNPDPALLPPLDAALGELTRLPRLYGERTTLPGLVRFAASEFEADGIAAQAVTVVSGALDGIDLVLREHLRPGDRVGVEDPGFPALLDLIAAAGLTAERFEVDDDGPVPGPFSAVLKRTRAVIVTPRAQNPMGGVVSEARARELRRLLRQQTDTLVIEDDHAGPVSGSSVQTLSTGRLRWAVVRSTGTFLGPDLRVAVLAGDPLTVRQVAVRQGVGMRWVSYLLQQLALTLWADPSNGRRFARAAEIYAQRREALLAALRAHGIGAHGRTGFNVWIAVPEESRVVQALADKGWAVSPGDRFRHRAARAIRVTAAALLPPDARRFANDLAEVLGQRPAGPT